MPNDLKAILYDTNFNIVLAGVTNYNNAIGSAILTGCQLCGPPLDNRADGRFQSKVNGAPTDYPQIRLIHTGGTEGNTVTPTFGLIQGLGCDAIVPKTFTMDLTITYDAGVQTDNGTTPLEEYIDAAYHNTQYPTLGMRSYGLRFFRFQDKRKDEIQGGISRIIFRRSMTFDFWPHIAVLQ